MTSVQKRIELQLQTILNRLNKLVLKSSETQTLISKLIRSRNQSLERRTSITGKVRLVNYNPTKTKFYKHLIKQQMFSLHKTTRKIHALREEAKEVKNGKL